MRYIKKWTALNLPDGARSHQEGHGGRARTHRRATHGAASAAQNRVRTLWWTHVWSSHAASPFARSTTLQTRDLRPSTYVLARYPWNKQYTSPVISEVSAEKSWWTKIHVQWIVQKRQYFSSLFNDLKLKIF